MARTFRRQRQSHPIAEMNVTNLIDLGFTLLIIFMIATPLINQEQTHPITLPSESKLPQQKPEPGVQFVTIYFDAKGFYTEGSRLPMGLAELRAQLQSYASRPKPPTIRIKGDARVEYQKMITLMEELGKANLLKITLDTQTNG